MATDATMTTPDMLALLRRLGLPVSRESLHVDVHRGLLSPALPDAHTPARGVSARWSAPAVRRAVYLYRLRRLGVNGRVLPLLLWLRDGWGWGVILPFLQESMRRMAQSELRALNKPHRVRTMGDVLDNVEQDDSWRDAPYPDAVLSYRKWIRSMLVFGVPAPGSSPVEALAKSFPALLGMNLTAQEQAELAMIVDMDRRTREKMGVALRDMPAWLATLDGAAVEKGRTCMVWAVRTLRRNSARDWAQYKAENPHATSTNPLTLGGRGRADVNALFREMPGRVTAARFLATMIAHGMMGGALIRARLEHAASPSGDGATKEPPRRLQPSGGVAHGKEPSTCTPSLPQEPPHP